MPIKLDVMCEGEWPALKKAIKWLERRSQRALDRAMRTEARHLKKELKQGLYKGGSPAFRPLSPFTIAIRKAMGTSGRKPLLGSRQLVQAIKHKRMGTLNYFSGVLKGTPYQTHTGTVDAAQIALYVEVGRGAVVLWLDKPSPRTGKTPRQWLWWLYLQGALAAPPSPSKNAIILRGSPERPFVRQTWERAGGKSGERIQADWIAAFEKEAGAGASTLFDWNAVSLGNPWEG